MIGLGVAQSIIAKYNRDILKRTNGVDYAYSNIGENMEIDDFKAFVRTIPSIKDEVVKGRYTWQQLYEFYVLYGADDKMWEPYKKSQVDLTGLLDIIKNVDLDALAKSFEGIQKVLDLVSGFVVKDEPKSQAKQWYDD